jgi:hypothetical protein
MSEIIKNSIPFSSEYNIREVACQCKPQRDAATGISGHHHLFPTGLMAKKPHECFQQPNGIVTNDFGSSPIRRFSPLKFLTGQ